MKMLKKYWLALAILLFLSPLGLILPACFNAGVPWGEWNTEEINKTEGYVPAGMAKAADKWNAPLPGYSFRSWQSAPLHARGVSYIIAGIAGTAFVVAIILLIGRLLFRNEDPGNS